MSWDQIKCRFEWKIYCTDYTPIFEYNDNANVIMIQLLGCEGKKQSRMKRLHRLCGVNEETRFGYKNMISLLVHII